MEPHSQNNDSPDSKQALEGQLRECFGRVVYSHKTHEKNAEIFIKRLSRIKFWQIVLSAITTGGCILVLLGAGLIGSIIASILSALRLFRLFDGHQHLIWRILRLSLFDFIYKGL